MIYIVSFFSISIIGFYTERTNNKNTIKLLFFLCSLIPIILIGFRSPIVGTDNYLFLEPEFRIMHNTRSILNLPERAQYDWLFRILTYFVSRFTDNYTVMCLVEGVILTLCVHIGLYKIREKISFGLSLMIYYFLFFCPMLCYIRQGMAIGFCILSLQYMFKNDTKKFIILSIIAALFHATAIIFLISYLIFLFLSNRGHEIKGIIILIVLGIATVNLGNIGNFLYSRGLLDIRYLKYLPNGISFSPLHTFVRIPLLAVGSLLIGKLKGKNPQAYIFYILLWVDLIVVQIAGNFSKAYRLAYYFMIFYILFIPEIVSMFRRRDRKIVIIILILALIIYWYMFTVYNLYGFTYPVYPYRFV